MALLLAMYQKMRLIREKNQTTYDLTKYTSKLDRVTKNIERIQKMYTNRIAKLEEEGKRMQTRAVSIFQNMAGLGNGFMPNTNPMTYGMGASTLNGYVLNAMQGALTSGIQTPVYDENGQVVKDSDGKPQTQTVALTPNEYQEMLQAYMAKGEQAFLSTKDADGNTVPCEFSPEKIYAFKTAMSGAYQSQSMAQSWTNQATTTYQNNVSIWLEQEKAKLEDEQESVLGPLQTQETMWELEKNQADQKLQRINANLQSYEQLCSQEAQNSAPKFGLG